MAQTERARAWASQGQPPAGHTPYVYDGAPAIEYKGSVLRLYLNVGRWSSGARGSTCSGLEISGGHRGGPIDQTVTGVRNEPTAVSGERVTDVVPPLWLRQCTEADRLDRAGAMSSAVSRDRRRATGARTLRLSDGRGGGRDV
ncbi:hypothetical protein AKJ27_14055 [Corynebacterium glutamicum]|nr:hypothetical protein AKJ27_14055 [Corynebacterium glutamicum]